MGLDAPTKRERYAIRRRFDVVLFLILIPWQERCYYPSLQDEGHEVRSTSLISTFSSFLFFSFFFFLFLLLIFLLLAFCSHSCPSKARRTLKVVKKFCSQSHDPFSQSCGYWSTDEETVKRTRVNRRQKDIRESSMGAQTRRLYYIECSISTSHQACIRNSFNFIQRAFSFSTLELVSMKFYRDQSAVFENNHDEGWCFRDKRIDRVSMLFKNIHWFYNKLLCA